MLSFTLISVLIAVLCPLNSLAVPTSPRPYGLFRTSDSIRTRHMTPHIRKRISMDLAPMPVRRTLASDLGSRSESHAAVTERSLLSSISLLSTQVDQLCSFRDGMNSSSNALQALALLSNGSLLNNPALFSSQCATQLLAFQQALGGYHSTLNGLLSLDSVTSLVLGGNVHSSLADVVSSTQVLLLNSGTIVAAVPQARATVGPLLDGIRANLADLQLGLLSGVTSGLLGGAGLLDFGPRLDTLVADAATIACACQLASLAGLCA